MSNYTVDITTDAVEVDATVPGPPGPLGPPGPPGAPPPVIEYQMPAADVFASVDHGIGRDPIAIQVFDENDVFCTGYDVSFPVPGTTVRLDWAVPIQGRIRLY